MKPQRYILLLHKINLQKNKASFRNFEASFRRVLHCKKFSRNLSEGFGVAKSFQETLRKGSALQKVFKKPFGRVRRCKKFSRKHSEGFGVAKSFQETLPKGRCKNLFPLHFTCRTVSFSESYIFRYPSSISRILICSSSVSSLYPHR